MAIMDMRKLLIGHILYQVGLWHLILINILHQTLEPNSHGFRMVLKYKQLM